MKKFVIKQKLMSLAGKFDVTDEAGDTAFIVEGSFLEIPKSFTISDSFERPVAKLTKKVWSFLPTFYLELEDGSSYTIRKELTFFKPRYRVDGLDMTVQGDLWDLNFGLAVAGQDVAYIHQSLFHLTSTYQIAVLDEAYTEKIISLVIAIDYVKMLEASRK